MGPDSETVLAIGNPNAGDGSAIEIIEKYVLPLLRAANISCDYHQTTTPQHAGELARQHLGRSAAPIIVAGGDGTIHDILNFVFLDGFAATSASRAHAANLLSLILIPAGTANAIYASFWPSSASKMLSHSLLPQDIPPGIAYKLQSVLSFIEKKAPPYPLSIALAQTHPTHSDSTSQADPSARIICCVVASTSLHAGILHSAEKYRSSIPGIERFKVAAGENIHKWSNARVELLPISSRDPVLKYDPAQKHLVPCSEERSVSLDGPFFYFLSTINVDRLEPQFVITPLAKTSPPGSEGAFDVVVVRPARKPKYGGNTDEERAALAQVAMEWFGQVYRGGEHIHYTYPAENGADPVYMTEYFRVGGWNWRPEVYQLSLGCSFMR
jgi:hypothetical protein